MFDAVPQDGAENGVHNDQGGQPGLMRRSREPRGAAAAGGGGGSIRSKPFSRFI